jgi:putative alpha-1,2-mannosidase
MSSWYIFNSLGFYPVNPASAQYMIGSPLFEQVSITLPQTGHNLVISAPGARTKPYIKGVKLDGGDILSPVLSHSDLISVKNLQFEMSSVPQVWGKNTV